MINKVIEPEVKSTSPLEQYPESLLYQYKSLENIPVVIFNSAVDASNEIARRIAVAIRRRQKENKNIVLGLATGSTPIRLYAELIRMHQEEGLSFKNVVTFNLDEYYGLPPEHPESYFHFMHEYLFNHIDILPENIHIPKGMLAIDEVQEHCDLYEKKILDFGGIDIQILGIGRTGHIGFNEPGSNKKSATRMVRLDILTRMDAKNTFGGLDQTPQKAITMGISTIMSAKEIYIMAWGQHKAEVVKKATEGKITSDIPSSFLQDHPNVRFIIDTAAAEKLSRVRTPWIIGSCKWEDDLICRGVTWLSGKCKKPILKLTNEDYNAFGLGELLAEKDDAYYLNLKVFNRLQRTITGWPGGKPHTDDSNRPERAEPETKRVIIFSPHPDDDVISMGGTFLKLVRQNHDVRVAYQTSGNIAVHSHDVLKYLEFSNAVSKQFKLNFPEMLENMDSLSDASPETFRFLKGLIRQGEARAAARYCGLKDDKIHFLNLPFYETGKVKKNALSQADIDIVKQLLIDHKPHQIFAAGDLADPHGTHRICLDVILEALGQLKDEPWIENCWLWLYRGAWNEYEIDEIQMAVPLSPEELAKKRNAIYMHQSQKDEPPYPGEDEREFWERSEQRNKQTANVYRKLGFAEYEAMEAFRRFIY